MPDVREPGGFSTSDIGRAHSQSRGRGWPPARAPQITSADGLSPSFRACFRSSPVKVSSIAASNSASVSTLNTPPFRAASATCAPLWSSAGVRGPGRKHGTAVSRWSQQLVSRIGVPGHAGCEVFGACCDFNSYGGPRALSPQPPTATCSHSHLQPPTAVRRGESTPQVPDAARPLLVWCSAACAQTSFSFQRRR